MIQRHAVVAVSWHPLQPAAHNQWYKFAVFAVALWTLHVWTRFRAGLCMTRKVLFYSPASFLLTNYSHKKKSLELAEK